MALFSRRKKDSARAPEPVDESESPAPDAPAPGSDPAGNTAPDGAPDEAAPGSAPDAASGEAAAAQPVPEVSISVSAYRGAAVTGPPPAAPQPTAPAAESPAAAPTGVPAAGRPVSGTGEPPAQTETVPGLRDNVLLREALAKVTATATPEQLMEVTRQLLQGHLFLRVRGDARALLSEGKGLPLAVGKVGDAQYVMAYSSGAALQQALKADGDTETSAMGQPSQNVMKHVLDGTYAGLLIDGSSSPARALLPRTVLEQALTPADPQLRLKNLLASSPRTPEIAARIAEALAEAPMWVAVNKTAGPDGAERVGVAEARTSDGKRLINVFSHPLEVVALGRGDRALPFTGAQLGRALRENTALSGVIVDPAGPWIALTRDDLGPVLALPDPPAAAAPAS